MDIRGAWRAATCRNCGTPNAWSASYANGSVSQVYLNEVCPGCNKALFYVGADCNTDERYTGEVPAYMQPTEE